MSAALLLTASFAMAEPGEYEMNDLGGTVVLEGGWDLAPGGWSDSSFKFQRSNKRVQVYVWHQKTQPDVNAENAAAWGGRHTSAVGRQSGISDASLASTAVETIAGRPTAIADITAAFEERTPIVARVLSFSSGGKTIFVRTMGQARYAEQVRADAAFVAETMVLQEAALEGSRSLSVDDEFTATLPEGWRVPFATELDEVRKITAALGEEELKPSNCMVGMRAHPDGDPDVLFACGTYMHLGPVDEHSFAGVELEVHEKFFGASDVPVEAAIEQTVGDRLGFFYAPREGYRLALAPYDKGLMMT